MVEAVGEQETSAAACSFSSDLTEVASEGFLSADHALFRKLLTEAIVVEKQR